jgi:hypothetical protein
MGGGPATGEAAPVGHETAFLRGSIVDAFQAPGLGIAAITAAGQCRDHTGLRWDWVDPANRTARNVGPGDARVNAV